MKALKESTYTWPEYLKAMRKVIAQPHPPIKKTWWDILKWKS